MTRRIDTRRTPFIDHLMIDGLVSHIASSTSKDGTTLTVADGMDLLRETRTIGAQFMRDANGEQLSAWYSIDALPETLLPADRADAQRMLDALASIHLALAAPGPLDWAVQVVVRSGDPRRGKTAASAQAVHAAAASLAAKAKGQRPAPVFDDSNPEAVEADLVLIDAASTLAVTFRAIAPRAPGNEYGSGTRFEFETGVVRRGTKETTGSLAAFTTELDPLIEALSAFISKRIDVAALAAGLLVL